MASTVPPPPPTVPPAPTPAPAAKKKTSPWVWVLAGCGGVVILVILFLAVGGFLVARKVKDFAKGAEKNPAVFAAKLAAAADPNIEIVSSDDEAGTVTLRNKKTGEEITLDAKDIKEGKLRFRNEKGEEVTFEGKGEKGSEGFTVKSDKGEMTFGTGSGEQLPSWVPTYPGAAPEGTYATRGPEGVAGGVTFKTSDGAEKVMAHFKSELESAGFTVDESSYRSGGALSGGILHGTKSGGRRTVTISVGTADGGTQAMIQYEEKSGA